MNSPPALEYDSLLWNIQCNQLHEINKERKSPPLAFVPARLYLPQDLAPALPSKLSVSSIVPLPSLFVGLPGSAPSSGCKPSCLAWLDPAI